VLLITLSPAVSVAGSGGSRATGCSPRPWRAN